MKTDWSLVRTCSHVSSGLCVGCGIETYFEAYRSNKDVLCQNCYLKFYDPETLAAKKAAIEAAEKERLETVANPPEGSIRTESGTLLGPAKDYIAGGIVFRDYRQVLKEGLFGTESINTDVSSNLNFFKSFKNEK